MWRFRQIDTRMPRIAPRDADPVSYRDMTRPFGSAMITPDGPALYDRDTLSRIWY